MLSVKSHTEFLCKETRHSARTEHDRMFHIASRSETRDLLRRTLHVQCIHTGNRRCTLKRIIAWLKLHTYRVKREAMNAKSSATKDKLAVAAAALEQSSLYPVLPTVPMTNPRTQVSAESVAFLVTDTSGVVPAGHPATLQVL